MMITVAYIYLLGTCSVTVLGTFYALTYLIFTSPEKNELLSN